MVICIWSESSDQLDFAPVVEVTDVHLVVQVMSSTKFTEKRIGYLAASQSFHQDTEVLQLSKSNSLPLILFFASYCVFRQWPF